MTLLIRAQPFIAALNARETTIREVARQLECNESLLSRTLKGHLDRVPSSSVLRKNRQTLVESRQVMRKKHAKLVVEGHKSLRKAAADAKCSQRTIRRYMESLNGTEEPQPEPATRS